MRKKKQTIIIASVVALLVVAVALLAWLNRPKGEIISGSIRVIHNGETLRTFTMEEIAAMPYVEVEKEIVSSSYANEAGLYRGVPLRALLGVVDESLLDGASRIISRAEDGFVTAYSAAEVAESDSVIVAYQRDGESLGTKADGGSGPFRIVIVDDEFGNRSTKYLYEIEVS